MLFLAKTGVCCSAPGMGMGSSSVTHSHRHPLWGVSAGLFVLPSERSTNSRIPVGPPRAADAAHALVHLDGQRLSISAAQHGHTFQLVRPLRSSSRPSEMAPML